MDKIKNFLKNNRTFLILVFIFICLLLVISYIYLDRLPKTNLIIYIFLGLFIYAMMYSIYLKKFELTLGFAGICIAFISMPFFTQELELKMNRQQFLLEKQYDAIVNFYTQIGNLNETITQLTFESEQYYDEVKYLTPEQIKNINKDYKVAKFNRLIYLYNSLSGNEFYLPFDIASISNQYFENCCSYISLSQDFIYNPSFEKLENIKNIKKDLQQKYNKFKIQIKALCCIDDFSSDILPKQNYKYLKDLQNKLY